MACEARGRVVTAGRLWGSSNTLDGIGQVIAAFYAGERKDLRPVDGAKIPSWTVHRADGRQIAGVIVVQRRGRYRFEGV